MAGGRQTLHSERFCGRSNGRIKPIVPDAASVMSGGFAQIATFAKSGDLPARRRSYAARAMEGADVRRKCSHQPSSNGRDVDKVTFRYGCADVRNRLGNPTAWPDCKSNNKGNDHSNRNERCCVLSKV